MVIAVPAPAPPRKQQNQQDQEKHASLGAGFQKPTSAHVILRSARAEVQKKSKKKLPAPGVGLEWAVLNWNTPAIDFYNSLGATPIVRVDHHAPLRACAG
jgi:hypothetical protein